MAAKKRRIVLHVGIPKTATTSLQELFAANRQMLAANGVHYPDAPRLARRDDVDGESMDLRRTGWINHAQLYRAINPTAQARFPENRRPTAELWRSVDEEFRIGGLATMLISYELFSTQAHRVEWESVREIFDRAQLVALLYVRRLDHWVESMYSKAVRGRARLSTPVEKTAWGRKPEAASLVSMIDRLSTGARYDQLIVRNFDQPWKGDILQDVDKALGTDLATRCSLPTKNARLSGETTLLLRHANRFALEPSALAAFVHAVQQLDLLGVTDRNISLIPVDLRDRLIEVYERDAEVLRERSVADLPRIARMNKTSTDNVKVVDELSTPRRLELLDAVGDLIEPRFRESLVSLR